MLIPAKVVGVGESLKEYVRFCGLKIEKLVFEVC